MAESRHGEVPPPAFSSLLESTLEAHRAASRRAARSLSISPHGLVTLLMPMEGWTPPLTPSDLSPTDPLLGPPFS